MNRRITSTVLSLLVVSLATSVLASPTHLWSLRAGSTGSDRGQGVAYDASGNVYVTGFFEGTVNFGGGNLVSAGMMNAFLVKYAPNGTHLWSLSFGGPEGARGWTIAVDGSGNVCFGGGFNGEIDLGGGVLTSNGFEDTFLAKFDSDGNHIWSKGFGSSIGGELLFSLAVDGSDRVYITGEFFDTANYGGAPLVSEGLSDVCLASYEADGTHRWSRSFGSPDVERGVDVAATGAGEVFATGFFPDQIIIGVESPEPDTLDSAGNRDFYVARFTTNGDHVWAQSFGTALTDESRALGLDGAGNVCVAGFTEGALDLGSGPLPHAGSRDMFVASLSYSGQHIWSRSFGSTSFDEVVTLAVDAASNVILSGLFLGDIDFGGGVLSWLTNGPTVIASYDSGGNHLWSQNYSGPGAAPSVIALATNNPGELCATGGFIGTVNFGGGPLTAASSQQDIFVVEFDTGTASGVGDTPGSRSGLSLSSYPNPFNPSTTVRYTIPTSGAVTLAIYDVRGARVATLVNGAVQGAGPHAVAWNGRTDDGVPVSSGAYFARIEHNGATESRKLLLLK